jgi:hypothetical protein
MQKAGELLRQGKNEELWQMCCGYIHLDIQQFMSLQRRLLLEQIQLLNKSAIGRKLMNGVSVLTVDDFRRSVPLTSYSDYCPELSEKMENTLPGKPAEWIHTSGKSGEYACKWVPMTSSYIQSLSPILYGIGLMSSCKSWGDSSRMPEVPQITYTVAPRPYMSGALASFIGEQTPLCCHPSLEIAEKLSFEERVKLGFEESLNSGLDYFFGLSLVLALVGDKFSQSAGKTHIQTYLSHPKALARLASGLLKARVARRNLLPRDLWKVKGIITSGLDSSVYKEKIMEYWGRYPLDIYSSTEGGVIATQTWDYGDMTFIPNLNFLEFISEKEHLKWQLDHSYQPATVLLDEVQAGESYEIVITNFHGGALMRYRIGDMVRIKSLQNENLGIRIPQMEFDRRADDIIDLGIIRLTEKSIWKAIERIGVPYVEWIAYKQPGELTLDILIETDKKAQIEAGELSARIFGKILEDEDQAFGYSPVHREEIKTSGLKIRVTLLPQGTFARYTSHKQEEGADLAHLKPPHINIKSKELSSLLVSYNVNAGHADEASVKKSPALVTQ